jgi:hypothetical protein
VAAQFRYLQKETAPIIGESPVNILNAMPLVVQAPDKSPFASSYAIILWYRDFQY